MRPASHGPTHGPTCESRCYFWHRCLKTGKREPCLRKAVHSGWGLLCKLHYPRQRQFSNASALLKGHNKYLREYVYRMSRSKQSRGKSRGRFRPPRRHWHSTASAETEESDSLEKQKSAEQFLGLTPPYTRNDVDKAFRRLALQYHPDRIQSSQPDRSQATLNRDEQMKLLNEHRTVLLRQLDPAMTTD